MLKFYFVLFLCFALTACGFKLKGYGQVNALGEQLSPLYLQLPADANYFGACLTRQLIDAGVRLVGESEDNRKDNLVHLVVQDFTREKIQLSDNQLSAKEYELELAATASLTRMQKEKFVHLLPPLAMRSTKRMEQDSNQVNAGQAEEVVLFAGLQTDLCLQVMRYLQSLPQ